MVSQSTDLIPKFEELSLATKIDESKLIEIKDTKLTQRFVDHVPNAGQTVLFAIMFNSKSRTPEYDYSGV